MAFITALATNDLVRVSPSRLAARKGYLQFGTVYPASLQNDWYYIPSLHGYSHKSVVREVPDPATPRPPAIPIYFNQWTPNESDARQNDCGPTCLRMILAARGDTTTVNQLRTKSPTGLTDAPELQNILAAHGVQSVIARDDPSAPLDRVAKAYSLLLINYSYLPRSLVQDVRFTGPKAWHWLIYVDLDPADPTQAIVLDPDYWGTRGREGDHKRYPVEALRRAWRPYGSNITTTALYCPDLQVQAAPLPIIQTKKIKTGIHVYENANQQMVLDFARRTLGKCAGFVVTGYATDLANKLVDLGCFVVYRPFVPDPETYNTNWLNKIVDGKTVPVSEAEAIEIGRRFWRDGKERQWAKKVSKKCVINPVNEKGYHPMDYAFTLGYLMENDETDGFLMAIGGDSYGTPRTATLDNGVEEFATRIPAMEYARKHGHYWTINSYAVDDGEGYKYLGGRYIEFFKALPESARCKLIMKETGVNDGTRTDPSAMHTIFAYGDKTSADEFGPYIEGEFAWTVGRWPEFDERHPDLPYCSLDSQLPVAVAEFDRRENGVQVAGTIEIPTPPPPPPVPPTPPPTPKPAAYQFPFTSSVRGIHGNAGGWQPNAAELDTIRRNHIELLFIATYEQNQAAVTVQAMRGAGVKYFVLRATHRGNWSDFASGSLPRLKEYAAALGGSNGLAIQIHNEPNLTAEGLGSGWRNGIEFADFYRRLADVYRKELPGCKLGFPALSPGGDIAGVRQADSTFARQASAAIAESDWVGVHFYYAKADGSDIKPPLTYWRELYGNKALLGSEIGPVNALPVTASLARMAYTIFSAAGVPVCAWLLSSPTNDFALQNWTKQGITL